MPQLISLRVRAIGSFMINGYDDILQIRVIGYGSSKTSATFKTNNPGQPSLARRNIELGR